MPGAGGYELVHRFARGETAELYVARRHGAAGFVRDCVVKKLLPELRDEPEAVDLFLSEARMAAQLQHRNIAQVIDLGRLPDGSYFAAVALVDGPDAAMLIRRAAEHDGLPAELALWIIARAADGVHYAHELTDPVSGANLGLVHGHLSPGSIIVSLGGAVRLLGFSDRSTSNRGRALSARSLAYAAPELRRGEPLTRAADVYALAAILYELLTGSPPPRSEPVPPPSSRGGPADEALDALVLGALSPRPSARPETAGLLGVAINRRLFRRTADARDVLSRWMAAHAADLSPARRGRQAEEDGIDELPESALVDAIGAPNLSRPATPMVGGDRTLKRITRHLAAGKRLICLRGTPGIGKSRVALQAALAHVAGGGLAWQVDLHEVGEVSSACAAVAEAMSVGLPGAGSEAEAIAGVGEHLSGVREAWLLLDGLDLLADSAAAMLEAWLVAAPELIILATSRQRLEVPARTAASALLAGVVVQPLALPARGHADLQLGACRLFVQRAARAHPGWKPGPADAALIAAIVRRLDGIPLAIELAAARLAQVPIEELARHLDADLNALGSGGGRQGTMRGAIGWSWTLLSAEERRALLQLSVFVDGFDRDSARAVLELDPGATDGLLDQLRDRSMLRVLGGRGDTERLGMYASVRSYIEVQPDADTVVRSAARRHAAAMLAVAEDHGRRATTHDARAAITWLTTERENLLAIHRRALATRPLTGVLVTEALRVPCALYPLMVERGPQGVLQSLFRAAIDAAMGLGDEQWDQVQAGTLAGAEALLADMLATGGNPAEGLAMADRAVEHAGADRPALALAHFARSDCLRYGDRMQEAIGAATAARTICQQTGDTALEAQALNTIGAVFYDLGEREMSAGCFQAALAAARQVGHQLQISRTTGNLGCIYADRGDMVRAAPYFHEALGDARRLGNRRGEGVIHSYLGIVAQERGNFGLARVHYRRGLEILGQVGDRHRKAYVEALYAWMLAETRELERAEELLRAVVDDFVARGDWRLRAMYLATLAFILTARGRRGAVDRLLSMADKLATGQSDPIAPGAIGVFRAGILLLDDALSAAELRRASAMLQAVRAPRPPDDTHPDGKPPLTMLSSEVRTAMRILAANGVELGEPAATTPGEPT